MAGDDATEKNEPLKELTEHRRYLVQIYIVIATLLITLNPTKDVTDTIYILQPSAFGGAYIVFIFSILLYSISLTPAKYQPIKKVKTKSRLKNCLQNSEAGYKDYYFNTIVPAGKIFAIVAGFAFAFIFFQFMASYGTHSDAITFSYNNPAYLLAAILPLGIICTLSLWF